MSIRFFPGSSLRAILQHDLSHSKQVKSTLYNRASARNFHSCHRHHHHHHQYQSHGPSSSSNSKPPRSLIASGLGITLIGATTGSFDSDHHQSQNFGETNFDTIRPHHTRQPSSRSNMPSFSVCPSLDNCKTLDDVDDDDDDQMSDLAGTAHRHPNSLASAPASFNYRLISFPPPSGTVPYHHQAAPTTEYYPHRYQQNSKKPRPNHTITHYSSQSTLVYRRPRPSDKLPSSICSSTSSSSVSSSSSSLADEVHASTTSPQYHCPSLQSSSFTTPLRNCQSLHFTKQNTQSRHSTHNHHSSHPKSRSLSPLTSPQPQKTSSSSYHPSLLPVSHFSSELPALYEHQTTISPCPSELLAFPLQNSANPTNAKFTQYVKTQIQRTRRSLSHSRSFSVQPLQHPRSRNSSISSNNHPPHSSMSTLSSVSRQIQSAEFDLPSTTTARDSSWHRSVSYSALSEGYHSLPRTSCQLQNMHSDTDHEVESLLEHCGAVPNDFVASPPRPPYSSQPSVGAAEHHTKKTISMGRSQSAMGNRQAHTVPRRSATSNRPIYPLSRSANPLSSHHKLAAKPGGANGNGSPPLKSVRTHLSWLAQLLTPSPTIKHSSAITSKTKIPSPPSDPRLCSSTPLPPQVTSRLPSRQSSAKVFNTPHAVNPYQKPSTTPMEIINWRTTISEREYRHILETWGSIEVHRQQLIWELCQTETAFLDSLAMVLDLFIDPLRDECQDGTWVVGVPEPVQKLFTDLDHIANFHSEIVIGMSYNRMCEKQRNKASVVIKFADMMASFVPRLRIYERYLVCFERVSQQIDRLSLDPIDHFGSFVRMQSHTAGFGAMTLTSYLLKPIQRLMKYPLFFRQLCETTPLGHPDHQATSNLWKATDGIIRSMQDVKGLEDDHDALKALEECLIGLPEGLTLANRRRKIVNRGTLQMVYPSHKDILKLPSTAHHFEARESLSARKPGFRRMSSSSHLPSGTLPGEFHHNISARGIIRSLSPVSDSSETTHSQSSFHSMKTDTTFEATSSPKLMLITDFFSKPRSTSGCSIQSTSRCDPPSISSSEPPKLKAPRSLQSKRSSHKLIKGRGTPTENVEVILLTDMLILCTREAPSKKNWRVSSRKCDDLNRFRILEGIGLSKLTCVTDLGGQLGDFDELVRLELKPLSGIPRAEVTGRKVSLGTSREETAQDQTVYLSTVSHSSPLVNGSTTTTITGSLPLAAPNSIAAEKEWANWLKEFKKLQMLTLHAHQRQLKHSDQKRRRSSHTGRIDLSIKKSSSMSTLI
ncbi:hypothetical protein VP01_615g2 [Puccinia sorghi]|uniref:DH domain-containing protein n=1 Tax=Puccinia sorghi TaxID=27349 RepID=A0A0L6UGV1_9BASI|nr:hypothetical protein VP01_615g2 [Puccinia sorghi]